MQPGATGQAPIPAILFEPDGYLLAGPKLMGRQAAGNGFLRAVVEGLEGETLLAYTPNRNSALACQDFVRGLVPEARVGWLRPDRHDLLRERGGLFTPDPGLGGVAAARLRAGPAAWSLSGVTHTLSSHLAMKVITDLLTAPVMPWDALVCTSQASRSAVGAMLEDQAEYLRWRLGARRVVLPQLPVIPLGVHARDFAPREAGRAAARRQFGLAEGEVTALFAGRLSHHAKAHPLAMFTGLQAAAERTGARVALLLCGQFANAAAREAFLAGAANHAPRVRTIVVDGKDFAAYGAAWSAADIFVSLSDNLQETFGITPVEAMAAGLPVVVTDWDGYRDTVREGETGFRVPCWMPAPGRGEDLAAQHEDGVISYDRYIGYACLEVALDQRVLADRLSALVADPRLRARLGAAGQARVRADYDWAVVFRRYRALWTELAAIRARMAAEAGGDPAPARAPWRQDPYRVFAGFAPRAIGPDTRVRAGEPPAPWARLRADPLFHFAAAFLPSEEEADLLLGLLGRAEGGAMTLAGLSDALGWTPARTAGAVARLAKAGVLHLEDPAG